MLASTDLKIEAPVTIHAGLPEIPPTGELLPVMRDAAHFPVEGQLASRTHVGSMQALPVDCGQIAPQKLASSTASDAGFARAIRVLEKQPAPRQPLRTSRTRGPREYLPPRKPLIDSGLWHERNRSSLHFCFKHISHRNAHQLAKLGRQRDLEFMSDFNKRHSGAAPTVVSSI